MGKVKEYFAEKELYDVEMCKTLIKSHQEVIHNEAIEHAMFIVTAREIMNKAIEHFWVISTDADEYRIEVQCEDTIICINPLAFTFEVEIDCSGGGMGNPDL